MRRHAFFPTLFLGAACFLSAGCFALSIGGGGACRTRLDCLERRVDALERQNGTVTSAPSPAFPPGPISDP
jgi:hypothetical protein